jgi:two-component system cell cycle response regulator DivK
MLIQNQEKTVMIVEDNKFNMKLAVDLLELAGFNIIKAFDGETALEILKTQRRRPDLVLLDIGLPGISGDEVYKQIRAIPGISSMKIAAVSASVMRHEKEKMLQVGFDAFIAKPIDIVNFIKEIEALTK